VSFYRGRYEEALSWSEKSEPLTVKAGNPMTIVNTRRQMGKSLMGLKRYDEAIAIFEKLLVLMDANPQFAFIEERSNIKKYLAQAVALKGGAPQVAAWIDDYSRGQDSIHNFVVAQAVEDLRIQYETQLVEDSLQLLQMENRLQTAKTTRYQISFFGGMALAISLGALLFYFLRQRRLEREIFQRQNELLLRENASLFDRIHAMERSSAPRSLQDFSNDAIVLNGNEKTVFRIGDIFFIQSQGNGVQVVTANDRHWRWQTMRNLSEALPCPPFIRVHRSFLINGMHIQKYSAQQLTLVNGDVIPVGITQAARVEDFLSKWLPDLV
jgi:tetratricopeptide (TPR) repeat protein